MGDTTPQLVAHLEDAPPTQPILPSQPGQSCHHSGLNSFLRGISRSHNPSQSFLESHLSAACFLFPFPPQGHTASLGAPHHSLPSWMKSWACSVALKGSQSLRTSSVTLTPEAVTDQAQAGPAAAPTWSHRAAAWGPHRCTRGHQSSQIQSLSTGSRSVASAGPRPGRECQGSGLDLEAHQTSPEDNTQHRRP